MFEAEEGREKETVNICYQEGRDAQHWGKSVDDNPYMSDLCKWLRWLDGYLDAQYEGMYD